jgi:phosphatidyl-myo-inositol dimannoside synthase
MMKLLFVSQDYPPAVGGIQTYARELATRLAVRTPTTVLAPAADGSDEVDIHSGPDVVRVRARPDLLPLALIKALPPLAKQRRFDVSFHAQWQTSIAALLSRRLTGFPRRVAVAAHGRELLFTPFGGFAGRLYDRVRRWTLASTDALFPVSHYTKRLLLDLGAAESRIQVIHNGTDPAQFRPVDPARLRRELELNGRRVILTVSRLVGRKGVDTVIEAMPAVLRAHPATTYIVVGDGPERASLESQCREHLPDADVRFLGRIPNGDLPAYYSMADFAVMPSRNVPPDVEGFGIVFLEANACGCPVIGAISGGIPDAVIDGTTGLLVPPGDASALGNAMVRLLDDEPLRTRLALNGKKRVVNEANWDRAAETLFAGLERLVKDAE